MTLLTFQLCFAFEDILLLTIIVAAKLERTGLTKEIKAQN